MTQLQYKAIVLTSISVAFRNFFNAGKNCEVDINECQLGLCINGATCVDGINDFQCECMPGFRCVKIVPSSLLSGGKSKVEDLSSFHR